MNQNISKKVLGLKPLKNYERLDIDRLVAFGMHYLEKQRVPLYFEYIAAGLLKLFPKRFSMENFKQYPDTFRVNNSVRRLAGSIKAKGAKWATGSVENGFALTETGREIAKQVKDYLEHPEKQISKAINRSRGRSPLHDLQELRNSPTYKKWLEDKGSITQYDIFSLLGAMPYAPKELLTGHFEYLIDSAKTAKDKKILAFLQWAKVRFNSIFN